jgi:hypothetical protein
LSFEEMSMKVRVVDTFGVLSNTFTCPVFCTTYQRAEFPGSCSIATGCVKPGRLANTRCTANDTVLAGASPARQVVLDGRASRPEPGGGGVAALVVALPAVDTADSLGGVPLSKALTV